MTIFKNLLLMAPLVAVFGCAGSDPVATVEPDVK